MSTAHIKSAEIFSCVFLVLSNFGNSQRPKGLNIQPEILTSADFLIDALYTSQIHLLTEIFLVTRMRYLCRIETRSSLCIHSVVCGGFSHSACQHHHLCFLPYLPTFLPIWKVKQERAVKIIFKTNKQEIPLGNKTPTVK